MKLGRILMALGIVATVGIFVFGTAVGLVYAKTGIDNTDTKGGATIAEKQMPKGDIDLTAKGPDKGSPMHGWKAIVASGKKAGDTITTKEFAGMRDWSARTIGYELQSLENIKVVAHTGARGQYKLLVDATAEQIDQINELAKPIVNKTSRDGTNTALGIDTWILDVHHLGEGKVEQIADVVKNVTGSNVTSGAISEDFVQEDIDAGRDLPASAVINDENIPFAINEIGMEDKVLLAALIDARMVSPEAKMKAGVADFSAVKVKTAMIREELLDKPEDFKAEFNRLPPDATAVIIAINKNNEDIIAALREAGLLGQWGNRIVVMGVKPESLSAAAFVRFFGDKNVISLYGQPISRILDDRNLTEGLSGAV